MLLNLKAIESIQSPDEPLRVIHYFCSARSTSQPDLEKVILSLILKLSRRLDRTIASSAYHFYSKWEPETEGDPSIDDWTDLLDALIAESGQSTRIVVLVDGLDAFEKSEEGELFLETMEYVAAHHHNVFFVFSSHQYVLDGHPFQKSLLVEYKVRQEDTRKDLEAFIDTEIKARAPTPGEDSEDEIDSVNEAKGKLTPIFCMNSHLNRIKP